MPSTCVFTDISTKVKEWTFCQFQPNDLFWNNEMKSLGPSPCYWITVLRLKIKDTWFYWFNEGWRLLPSSPRARGTSLVGRYLHWATSPPFVWFCDGACLWAWLWWPTGLLPVPHEAVECLQWFRCVSLDRETGGEAAPAAGWSCRKRWQGESTSLKKKKSQIKQTGKEIALLAAKEIVLKTYYFSAELFQLGF